MKKRALTLLLLVASLVNPPWAIAFDGTDSEAPKVISMRLLTDPPSSTNDLVALELMTQDDKNWVKISGTVQLGYSFAIKDSNAAPNCAVGSTSFSKFEVVEDERARSAININPKKQRFLLFGFVPRPKALPANCPEYRNLELAPAVALNTSTFTTSVNRTTGARTISSNIFAPSLQDESGRTLAAAINTGVLASSLTFTNQAIVSNSQYCILPTMLPQNNTSISSTQKKFFELAVKVNEANLIFESDPTVVLYESQVKSWNAFLTEPTISRLRDIGKCGSPLTVQQVNGAYQSVIKSLETILALKAKSELEVQCSTLNSEIQATLDLLAILKGERIEATEYAEFASKSRTIRAIDCAKVNSKSFSDAKTLSDPMRDIRESLGGQFLKTYCEKRNLKGDQFANLEKGMSVRYKKVIEWTQWKEGLGNLIFGTCNPSAEISQLLDYSKNTDRLILEINNLLLRIQGLEREKRVKITILCKMGKKTLQQSGKSPKCPAGYSEVKAPLSRIT